MDFYTLTESFLAKDVVDEFHSSIWTERYSTPGDVQLVLPITTKNLEMLKEGTYLALRGSKEIMEIETLTLEEGVLKVHGTTLDLSVLTQRFVWASDGSGQIVDISDATKVPGQFISHLVDRFAIRPHILNTVGPSALDWPKEVIEGLSLGPIDDSGTPERITAATGPLFEAVTRLAEQYKIGVSLYLDSADPVAGYSLKFKTYRGKDRSSTQTVNPLVRLVPELDGISKIKEIRSNAKYKNVAYVWYAGTISKHLADPDLPEPEGLARRVLVTDAVGSPVGRKVESTIQPWYAYRYDGYWGGASNYSDTVIGPEEVAAFREQNAKDALANHNYIRAIDGETSPISDYKFGEHYDLGDVIELEGLTGAISKARITEYIRTQDKNGERSYPTISVES